MNRPYSLLFTLIVLAAAGKPTLAADSPHSPERLFGVNRGIIAVLGLDGGDAGRVVGLAKSDGITVYFQSPVASEVAAVRKAAESAKLLGTRVFVDAGSLKSVHLARNVADGVLVAAAHSRECPRAELLRVLRPRGIARIGTQTLTKPVPQGIDEWTHPYHRPDNNPQSTDKLARGEFRTQFIADPKFSPMPEQTVVAGGRMYKAMGHIAHKANQNAMLNTLLCINAYNGTILWKRPLPKGFMIHRNTMIATDDALYMGDDKSCKVFDGKTGKIRAEIVVPKGISDGPVWKWMGMRGDTLVALVGSTEIQVDTQKSARRGLGHWPWGMWKGHDYKDPRLAFGFGRTLLAVDLRSHKIRWHHREKTDFLDARALCMKGDRIYVYSPEKFLACLNAADGKLLWKNSDKDLLKAIGPNGKAQHYVTGYATACYMKCNDKSIFFAGPQRSRLVVASAKDGKLKWTYPVGNLQLVLRDDALYAAGPQRTKGVILDYDTGKTISTFIARRACTRATGSVDSIFFRATGGTVRLMTDTKYQQHIAPMRPPCQDGVVISNGYLYWGPWMCGCQLSLYGNIGLRGQRDEDVQRPEDVYRNALVTYGNVAKVASLGTQAGDWTAYRGNNSRSDVSSVKLPDNVKLQWRATVSQGDLPTAPVAAGGMVFVADRTGAIRALNADGKPVWKAHANGAVYYAPAVAHDRLYVGSADGRVYAFEAKTGRPLWTFRVAPRDRRIPVYGKLISRWPVAGGVVVQGNTVYAAAGIAHYDGTYVVALDAITGKLKARNDTSGTLAAQVNSGISIQGNLKIVGGELRFLGGGVYETARYDLKTLKCLNPAHTVANSKYRTAFYPYYPDYGKYVSLAYRCTDGCSLNHDASYEGSLFSNLALDRPLPKGAKKLKKDAAKEYLRLQRRRGKVPPKHVWRDGENRRFNAFIVSGNRLLAAGHKGFDEKTAFLSAITIKDGKDVWRQPLPALPVKGGAAIDHQGRIYVALENGQLLCFAAAK
jgi:outer membrane protein assembly factor BamB